MISRFRTVQLGFQLLACCIAVGCTCRSILAQTATGTAYFTLENFPLPSAAYTPFGYGINVAFGTGVIQNRIAFEKALIVAANSVYGIGNVALRLVNYTDYPSVTPGLEAYQSRRYHFVSYAPYPIPYHNIWGTGSFFTNQAQASQRPDFRSAFQSVAKIPADLVLVLLHSSNPNFENGLELPSDANVTDSATLTSRIQITGLDLVPFTADKRMLFITDILQANSMEALPMTVIDFADAAAAEAATDVTPALLNSRVQNKTAACATKGTNCQGRNLLQNGTAAPSAIASASNTQTITVDIYTRVLPVPDMTVAAMWAQLRSTFSNLTAEDGLRMNVVLINASVTTIVRGIADPVVSNEFLPKTYAASNRQSLPDVVNSSRNNARKKRIIIGFTVTLGLTLILVAASAAFFARKRQKRIASRSNVSSYVRKASQSETVGDRTDTASAIQLSMSSRSASCYEDIPENEIQLDLLPSGAPNRLGAGAYGTVYAGNWRGCPVAVKQLNEATDYHAMAALHKEIDILKRVSKNRNVVQFFGISGCNIVTELMEGGNLRQALRQNRDEYAWDRRGKVVALDIARGLTFLHSSGVIHRDIKASNVLLTREGVAKIADVGLATTANLFTAGTTHGTWAYAAPELLIANMDVKCSWAVDMFSFGVLLWEIVTRETPVRGSLRQINPAECPPEVHTLLEVCITEDIGLRPTAASTVKILESLI